MGTSRPSALAVLRLMTQLEPRGLLYGQVTWPWRLRGSCPTGGGAPCDARTSGVRTSRPRLASEYACETVGKRCCTARAAIRGPVPGSPQRGGLYHQRPHLLTTHGRKGPVNLPPTLPSTSGCTCMPSRAAASCVSLTRAEVGGGITCRSQVGPTRERRGWALEQLQAFPSADRCSVIPVMVPPGSGGWRPGPSLPDRGYWWP